MSTNLWRILGDAEDADGAAECAEDFVVEGSDAEDSDVVVVLDALAVLVVLVVPTVPTVPVPTVLVLQVVVSDSVSVLYKKKVLLKVCLRGTSFLVYHNGQINEHKMIVQN